VSIPLSFLLGVIGTLRGKDRPDPARTDELEVRSITGIRAS
jgi:cation/acetate symporter